MTVRELIESLELIDEERLDLPVFTFSIEGEVVPIREVDHTLSDRIDLNLS